MRHALSIGHGTTDAGSAPGHRLPAGGAAPSASRPASPPGAGAERAPETGLYDIGPGDMRANEMW